MSLRKQDKGILTVMLIAFFALFIGIFIIVSKEVKGHMMVCNSREVVVGGLTDTYKETLLGGGIMPNGRVIEIYVNTLKRTWTLVSSSPTGTNSCHWASGGNWSFLDDILPPISKPIDKLDKT